MQSPSRYRWVTLAMLAAAVLTITAALEHGRSPGQAEPMPLTRDEIAPRPRHMAIYGWSTEA